MRRGQLCASPDAIVEATVSIPALPLLFLLVLALISAQLDAVYPRQTYLVLLGRPGFSTQLFGEGSSCTAVQRAVVLLPCALAEVVP